MQKFDFKGHRSHQASKNPKPMVMVLRKRLDYLKKI